MAVVTSTVAAYRLLADQPFNGQATAWPLVYEARHPEVFASYYSGWGDSARRAAAPADIPALTARVVKLETQARRALDRAERRLRVAGLLDEEVAAVLLVGVGTANGWVADLDGHPTVPRP